MRPGQVVLLVAVLLPAGVLARGKPSCALIPVGGAQQTLAGTPVQEAVARAIAQSKACKLRDPQRLAAELASARAMGFDCALDDTGCLRKLAALLRVRRVIALDAAPADAGLALRLVHVDGPSGKQLASTAGTLAPGAEPAQASALVASLLAPPRTTGALLVVVDRPGAQILVNGSDGGKSPMAQPMEDLVAGAYEVEVVADGFERALKNVDVVAGETSRVELALVPLAPGAAASAPAEASSVPAEPSSAPAMVRSAARPSAREAGPSPAAVGWTVAAAGGGLALLSGATALALDSALLFTDVGSADDRDGMLLAERVLAGVALVSVVVGGTGLGLALLAGEEAPAAGEARDAQAM
jgi:hypothetical protein